MRLQCGRTNPASSVDNREMSASVGIAPPLPPALPSQERLPHTAPHPAGAQCTNTIARPHRLGMIRKCGWRPVIKRWLNWHHFTKIKCEMKHAGGVVLTDGSASVLHVLRANTQLARGNGGARVCARALTSGDASETAAAIESLRPETAAPRRFACVVCSEVMYRSATLAPLLATIDQLLDERKGAIAFLCFKQRGQARRNQAETERHVAETLRDVRLRLRWIDAGEEGPAEHRASWKQALGGAAKSAYGDMSLCACERT